MKTMAGLCAMPTSDGLVPISSSRLKPSCYSCGSCAVDAASDGVSPGHTPGLERDLSWYQLADDGEMIERSRQEGLVAAETKKVHEVYMDGCS